MKWIQSIHFQNFQYISVTFEFSILVRLMLFHLTSYGVISMNKIIKILVEINSIDLIQFFKTNQK